MKRVIWYIDRDEQIAEVIRTQAPKMSENYVVETINNPIVIDGKLKEALPDLIFIDISIVGQDIIRDLKMRDTTKHIPLILTAVDVKIEDKAKELGVDSYLGKPFDMKMFFEKIEEVIQKK
jgi:response regulator RpfG family c-di-GMP phosphodiesterase